MPDLSGDLLKLIENLQDAQRKIVEATGGKVDAVLVSPAGPVLLPAAQQQLLRNEAEYRQFAAEKAAILDALPAHIALLDPDGMILTINKAWRDSVIVGGFSGQHFAVGVNYLSACETARPDDVPLTEDVASRLRAVLSGSVPSFSVEYSCGQVSAPRWFQFLGSPMPAHSGYGAVVMHVDIGERKQAEARTLEGKQRLETLVNEATVGIMVHQGWKVIMANDALARIFGYSSKEDILALPDFRVLYAPEEHARKSDYTAARLSGNPAPSHYEAKGIKLDGTFIDLESHAFALDWGDDRMVVCLMITNVTEKRGTEAQVRQLQKMEAVGQLTGGIAHDFNNILMVILSNSDSILEEEELSPDMRRRLEQISKAAEGAADLTRSLLAFSRKLPLRPLLTDINELVVNIGEMLRRTLGAQIEIDSVLADNLWAVNVDRAQLESALVNLCINARDAMPHGGRLLIETTNVERDEDIAAQSLAPSSASYVMLTVTDTGSGIAPELLNKVFEPFFTTKEVGKGTGLGLSMVYGFIKQSGGHVSVYSEIGVGTTIKLYFPRGESDEIKPAASVSRAPRGTERILVVEDDPQVRAAVVEQLRGLGYTVDEASNGADGLVAFEASPQPYDLLLTDVIMPGPLSSKELAAAVTRRRPETCVLFMSGFSNDAIVHGGRLDPGIHLISKPFRRIELSIAVRSLLDAVVPQGTPIEAVAIAKAPDAAPLPAALPGKVLIVDDDDQVREMAQLQLTSVGYEVIVASNSAEALEILARIPNIDLLFSDIAMPGLLNGREMVEEAKKIRPDIKVLLTSGYFEGGVTSDSFPDSIPLLMKPYRKKALAEKIAEVLKGL
jgi:PAS domain S-box-containing protein